jgi:hypothetical protein
VQTSFLKLRFVLFSVYGVTAPKIDVSVREKVDIANNIREQKTSKTPRSDC